MPLSGLDPIHPRNTKRLLERFKLQRIIKNVLLSVINEGVLRSVIASVSFRIWDSLSLSFPVKSHVEKMHGLHPVPLIFKGRVVYVTHAYVPLSKADSLSFSLSLHLSVCLSLLYTCITTHIHTSCGLFMWLPGISENLWWLGERIYDLVTWGLH